MRRGRLLRAVAALTLAAGCGVPVDANPRPIPDDRVPFDLLNPGPAPPTGPAPSPPTSR